MAEELILLRNGKIGGGYTTEKGHKVVLLRVRPGSLEPVVTIVATGHELVLPSETKVFAIEPVVVIPKEGTDDARRLLASLIKRLHTDSGITPEGIADLVPISSTRIESEIKLMTMEAMDGGVYSPYAASEAPPVG